VVTVSRGAVHEVVATSETSLSVHVYSPSLASMAFYDASGQRPVERMQVDERSSVFADTRVLHPVWSS
jgi:hypothetical protein